LLRLSILEAKQEAYQADISIDLSKSLTGHNPVLPLTAIQLHSKHGMYQGLEMEDCMDVYDHFLETREP
jgi:hypothetical protein